MVETTDYLIIGFRGNPDEIGFGEGKSPPSEVYFDYLGVTESGGLYVESGEHPLFKLLHPDYEDAENIFTNPTYIGHIDDNNFCEVLNEKPLTKKEIFDAFLNDTDIILDGFPYICNTFMIEADILRYFSVPAGALCELSQPGRVLGRYYHLRKRSKLIKDMGDFSKSDDEIKYVYMIVPEESPIVDQVAEIRQRIPQLQVRS